MSSSINDNQPEKSKDGEKVKSKKKKHDKHSKKNDETKYINSDVQKSDSELSDKIKKRKHKETKKTNVNDNKNCAIAINLNDKEHNDSFLDNIDKVNTSFEKHGNVLNLQISFVLKTDESVSESKKKKIENSVINNENIHKLVGDVYKNTKHKSKRSKVDEESIQSTDTVNSETEKPKKRKSKQKEGSIENDLSSDKVINSNHGKEKKKKRKTDQESIDKESLINNQTDGNVQEKVKVKKKKRKVDEVITIDDETCFNDQMEESVPKKHKHKRRSVEKSPKAAIDVSSDIEILKQLKSYSKKKKKKRDKIEETDEDVQEKIAKKHKKKKPPPSTEIEECTEEVKIKKKKSRIEENDTEKHSKKKKEKNNSTHENNGDLLETLLDEEKKLLYCKEKKKKKGNKSAVESQPAELTNEKTTPRSPKKRKRLIQEIFTTQIEDSDEEVIEENHVDIFHINETYNNINSFDDIGQEKQIEPVHSNIDNKLYISKDLFPTQNAFKSEIITAPEVHKAPVTQQTFNNAASIKQEQILNNQIDGLNTIVNNQEENTCIAETNTNNLVNTSLLLNNAHEQKVTLNLANLSKLIQILNNTPANTLQQSTTETTIDNVISDTTKVVDERPLQTTDATKVVDEGLIVTSDTTNVVEERPLTNESKSEILKQSEQLEPKQINIKHEIEPVQITNDCEPTPAVSQNEKEKSNDGNKPEETYDQELGYEKKTMLRQLKIFVPFKIPKSHLIETCIDNEPTENQIAELKTYNIINDNFNVKEDERIVNNFHDLRKSHRLPANAAKLFIIKNYISNLPQAEQIQFVRYIGRRLDCRTLYSIYNRFVELYKNTLHNFSKTDDEFIINYIYHVNDGVKGLEHISYVIGCDVVELEDYLKILKSDEEYYNYNLHTISYINDMIKFLVALTETKNVYDLKARQFSNGIWVKVGSLLHTPVRAVRLFWKEIVHPKIFLNKEKMDGEFPEQLIDYFITNRIYSWNAINWRYMAKIFPGCDCEKMQQVLLDLFSYYVPIDFQIDFKASLFYMRQSVYSERTLAEILFGKL